MSIVAGVDFGTLSVRVSIFDSERGKLGAGVAEYPLVRKQDDPDHATQSHSEQMRALAEAVRRALADSGVDGDVVESIAIDTTGSSVIPVDERLEPLDDYYLWCDHRAWKEAGERSLGQRMRAVSKRFTGAAASIPPNGVSRNCCTGCGTTAETAAIRERVGTLRHGRGHLVRHH